MKVVLVSVLFLAFLVTTALSSDDEGLYKIGVGIGDITGPPAGIVLNGYVNPITQAAGIYTRQFARAFVVQSQETGNAVAYVTCDMGMLDHSIKTEAIKRLQSKYGSLFSEKNVLISATHTHSGVSGFMTYFAYLVIESYGFNPITFWAAVDGIVDAISASVDSLSPGKIYWNRGELLGGNGNRRTQAYLNNPQAERDMYAHDVDKDMTLLKFVKEENNEAIGAFTWWPVHPISFNGGINPLVSSDNKGYAAILFDQMMNPNDTRPGKGKFVSGFGNANLGEVSPRNDGKNIVEGKSWDFTPDIRDARISGERQFNKAKQLFEDETNLRQIKGPIRYVHQFVDTTTVMVDFKNETSGETIENLTLCKAALGLSYVGLEPSPLLDLIRDLIKAPSNETVECQKPKHIALAAGEMDQPWPWAPSIVALQILGIGDLDVVGLPGEYTTMAGRRVRNAVFNTTGHEVVLAGLANNYINYVATPEEYDVDEYEGGATIYGRNTASVTTTLFKNMSQVMTQDDWASSLPEGDAPPSFLDRIRDTTIPWADPEPLDGKPFGSVFLDAYNTYRGGDEVKVVFNGGSPRYSPLRKGTFLTVEKFQEDGSWEVIRTDADLDTLFYWEAVFRRIEVKWFIPETGVERGFYRIRHFGYYRTHEDGPSIPYIGESRVFMVT